MNAEHLAQGIWRGTWKDEPKYEWSREPNADLFRSHARHALAALGLDDIEAALQRMIAENHRLMDTAELEGERIDGETSEHFIARRFLMAALSPTASKGLTDEPA